MGVASLDLPVFILVLLIDAAHEGSRGRQDLIDEDENSLLGGELDALADDVDELADSQVGGDKVLLLVDGGNVALLDLLANDLRRRQTMLVSRSHGEGEIRSREARGAASEASHDPVRPTSTWPPQQTGCGGEGAGPSSQRPKSSKKSSKSLTGIRSEYF